MAFQINIFQDVPYQVSVNNTALTWSGNPPVYQSGGIPQFYAVVADTATGNESDVKLCATANVAIVGIAQDAPAVGLAAPGQVGGQAVRVRVGGWSRMIAGGAITVGALIATNASGQGVVAPAGAATNSPVIGVAETAATAAGDVFTVRLTPGAFTQVTA